jgi:nucleotide-binding universal stress UspA family protein
MRNTIVVGYDGEEPAQRALDRAIEEAASSRAQLVVVAVIEMPLNPEAPQYFGTLDDSPSPTIPATAPPELEHVLAQARERVAASGVRADYVWAAGEPASMIVAAAKDRRASLIVLGGHHHGFFGRIFGEDVAGEVKREAGCSVVVVD